MNNKGKFFLFGSFFLLKNNKSNRATGAESMETNQDETSRPSVEESTPPKDKQSLQQEHKEKVNNLV